MKHLCHNEESINRLHSVDERLLTLAIDEMNNVLLLSAILATFSVSSAIPLGSKNATYIFQARVISNLQEEKVNVSFQVELKGPNVTFKTDLNGKPFGWYNGAEYFYLQRVPKEINLYDSTEYIVSYTTFEDDANADRVVSLSDVAITEPDVKQPKTVDFCSSGHKSSDKTDLLPDKPVTLTKCT